MVFKRDIGENLIPHLLRHGTKVKGSDNDSRLLFARMLFAIGIYASLLIAYYFVINGIALLPIWSFYIGITVKILGIILRQYSIAILGRYFSGTIGTQKGQMVIDQRPLQISAPSVIYWNTFNSHRTWINITIMGSCTANIIGIWFNIWISNLIEEKVLISNLGDEYIEYMKRTKRIIPYVL